jgi:hypothetical protein
MRGLQRAPTRALRLVWELSRCLLPRLRPQTLVFTNLPSGRLPSWALRSPRRGRRVVNYVGRRELRIAGNSSERDGLRVVGAHGCAPGNAIKQVSTGKRRVRTEGAQPCAPTRRRSSQWSLIQLASGGKSSRLSIRRIEPIRAAIRARAPGVISAIGSKVSGSTTAR